MDSQSTLQVSDETDCVGRNRVKGREGPRNHAGVSADPDCEV